MYKRQVQDTGIQIEGVLHIRFMYVRPDDQIPFALWQGMIPFSWLLESNEVQEDMTLDMMPSLEQLGISLLGNGEIEVKAVLDVYKRQVHRQGTAKRVAACIFDSKKIKSSLKLTIFSDRAVPVSYTHLCPYYNASWSSKDFGGT